MKKSSIAGYSGNYYRDHGPNFQDSEDMEVGNLYALQKDVPRLPVPELNHTFELFLKSVKPHVSEEEYAETVRKVKNYEPLAKELQQRLVAKAKSLPNTSWFIEFWNDYGYLSYRESVVWNVSYYLQFKDEFSVAMNPCRRAARFVYHALGFREQVVYGTLPPDMSKGTPMSNSQYKYMFNTARMPGEKRDFVRTYAPDLFNHIVVCRKNQFYYFDVVGKSLDEITAQFERVRAMADSVGTDQNPVGVLTAVDRDSWFANRKRLTESLGAEQNKANRKALEIIESSILAVCLDDFSPVTRDDVGRALLHSDGRNRFFDKSMQIVFFENGKAGYVGEHSMMDGTTTCRFVNETLDKMFADPMEVTQRPSTLGTTMSLLEEPSKIDFALDVGAKDAIAKCGRDFDEWMATKELSVLMFHGYGKQQIKKFKVSPDAYAQLAIQYAYYKTFGVFRGTYESTQTRSYLHGRTEVTRSVTSESAAFCRAMVHGKHTPQQLRSLLDTATQAHSSYIGQAAKANGCDRHLLGLKTMMRDGESSELYSDAGFVRSGTWAISTSGLVGELMDGWGFGEVVPHGIGVGYSVQNERIRYTVTSRHKGWARRLTANLESALVEMQEICQSAGPVQAKL